MQLMSTIKEMCSHGATEEMVNLVMETPHLTPSQRKFKLAKKSRKYHVVVVTQLSSPRKMSSGCVEKDAMVNWAEAIASAMHL